MVAKYPEDYDLYYLGEYNDQNGLISPLDTPQHMLKAISVNTPLKGANAQIGAAHAGTQPASMHPTP